MALQNFVDLSTPTIGATWLNKIDSFYTTLFGSSTTPLAARTAIGVYGYNVKDYGAVGDGSTDDTTSIQAAITACQGTGAKLFFPKGSYKISTTLNITGTLALAGESRYGTSITWTSTTLNAISIACDAEISIENFTFNGPLSATTGVIVSLTGGATQNLHSTISNCNFVQGYHHFQTTSAADWLISNCTFSNYLGKAIKVQNTYSPDGGDSLITGCTFASTCTDVNCTAIYQANSGGLKIIGNKIIGGNTGYRLQPASTGISTIDLVIVGNSIENQVNYGIFLERPLGSNTFGNVVIVGNQIGNDPVGIQTDAVAGWLSRITICGNQVTLPAVDGVGIQIGAASSFLIDGNEIFGQSGTTYGISIGSSCTGGTIGINSFTNCTYKVSNGAPTVVFATNSVSQTGTVSVTCSTAQASLYSGTASVTYATAFDAAPVVHCSANAVAGGVAAWPTSITKTGFTLNCISTTNGGGGNAAWDAQGIV